MSDVSDTKKPTEQEILQNLSFPFSLDKLIRWGNYLSQQDFREGRGLVISGVQYNFETNTPEVFTEGRHRDGYFQCSAVSEFDNFVERSKQKNGEYVVFETPTPCLYMVAPKSLQANTRYLLDIYTMCHIVNVHRGVEDLYYAAKPKSITSGKLNLQELRDILQGYRSYSESHMIIDEWNGVVLVHQKLFLVNPQYSELVSRGVVKGYPGSEVYIAEKLGVADAALTPRLKVDSNLSAQSALIAYECIREIYFS
jgi:hypothetical protein